MNYDPKDAVKCVVHDYVYLVAAGTDTQRDRYRHPFNHYAERTFLVHCRGSGAFFCGKGKSDDVYATDFTRGQFVRYAPTWDKWRDHTDKHLMHLAQARIKNKIPWDGSPNNFFPAELRKLWLNSCSK